MACLAPALALSLKLCHDETMQKVFPHRLAPGDEVRVIAPARSLAIISKEARDIANARLVELGLRVSFGKHVEESDLFLSSSIESRLEDLHDAFRDKNVKAILTVIGGYNSNQLLDGIDWELIRNNPKILCGYSDITVLCNAIFAKTGLVTYAGPHYSTLGEKQLLDYTVEYFKKSLMETDPVNVVASDSWSNDQWYKDQDNRKLMHNDGWWIVDEGSAKGTIRGGNLCSFNLLQGTDYFPSFSDETVLFLEDDVMALADTAVEFDRNLQSLIHQPGFEQVKGLVVGRFEVGSEMTKEKLAMIFKTKKALRDMPVIANVDFGHTTPMITYPIGGTAQIDTGHGAIVISLQ